MRHVVALQSRSRAAALVQFRVAITNTPNSASASPCRPWPGAQTRALSTLHHRHLGLASYDHAQGVQDAHRAEFLSWKALTGAEHDEQPPPPPLLVSFESTPTFTLGRRQENVDDAQLARLRRPLDVCLRRRREPVQRSFTPDVRKSSRGGLTTYHGPGQVVFWPVVDMHSPRYPRYGVASYASHLEATTSRLLRELFGIQTSTVHDEPGVWVAPSSRRPRKIAALGVHHRRHVTALGIALNVDVAVAGDEHLNPWARFVPCGLDGKAVTSVAAEAGELLPADWDAAVLAGRWAAIFEEGLLHEERRSGGASSRLR
ncbi:hypothetical protein RJ55_01776 [Drechmeria coniospora]|nr:hypothetical protein RJ55_01776 [Drechmeria coniospora]